MLAFGIAAARAGRACPAANGGAAFGGSCPGIIRPNVSRPGCVGCGTRCGLTCKLFACAAGAFCARGFCGFGAGTMGGISAAIGLVLRAILLPFAFILPNCILKGQF